MTLALDTSALIQRYVPGPHRDLIIEVMDADPVWCASELARTELRMAMHRIAGNSAMAHDLWASARADWDTFVVVPVDKGCLASAAEIGSAYGVRTIDAIHLASADRLPGPIKFATLDPNQISAAVALGFELISPATDRRIRSRPSP